MGNAWGELFIAMRKPKLTNDQIAEIKLKCKEGYSNAELSPRYGVSKMSITRIRNDTYFQGKSMAEIKESTKLTPSQIRQKILDGSRLDHVSGCWEWMCAKTSAGYGNIIVDGKVLLSHRISYSCFVGPLSDEILACHKCDNPGCCNPDHLFSGSHQDNITDKVKKGRNRSGGNHPQSVINEDTAVKIIEMLKSGMSAGAVAKELGIHHGIVWNVKYGKSWNDATGLPIPESILSYSRRVLA